MAPPARRRSTAGRKDNASHPGRVMAAVRALNFGETWGAAFRPPGRTVKPAKGHTTKERPVAKKPPGKKTA
ncbi:MAG: hypothetical protein PHH08_03915 [Candidatus ainarchaeum sp.]|nr:hypothetical protein [Candidatus ainarchaeum sp.]